MGVGECFEIPLLIAPGERVAGQCEKHSQQKQEASRIRVCDLTPAPKRKKRHVVTSCCRSLTEEARAGRRAVMK